MRCPKCNARIPTAYAAQALGVKGGTSGGRKTSKAKREASRRNGRLGGRPPNPKCSVKGCPRTTSGWHCRDCTQPYCHHHMQSREPRGNSRHPEYHSRHKVGTCMKCSQTKLARL